MFTGLVETSVAVEQWTPAGTGGRLRLPTPPGWTAGAGDSIAVCGVCLTVLEGGREFLDFDLSRETLARTWFGAEGLAAGRRVNLERPLRLGDRLDGHLVSGHVDGLATLVEMQDSGDGGAEWTFEVDPGIERYLVEKGSVTLDGISLTVVRPAGRRFGVALIPKTIEVTNFGSAAVGTRVNVEVDQVGKWIERLLAARA